MQSRVEMGATVWTLKDPLSLSYFRLRDVEFAVLKLLDGQISDAQILETLRQRFPAERWSLENVKGFLSSLVQSGLLVAMQPGQGRRQAVRHQVELRRRKWSRWTGWLAMRWKGVDPEPWLRRVEPWTNWLFRPSLVAALTMLIGFAFLLVVVRWDALIQRLPEAQSLFGLGNAVSLMIVFVGIKLLHELGHVLTCRRFGGECHELGIQVLLFVPLFYGDVTDAWMQSRRWPRIAISGAGIFVELVLASVATLLWWCSVPGVLNSLFLNVMLVCSVNTLLFNGNPLLRYDGYYMLADWLNIPNLGQQARQSVMNVLERLLFGLTEEESEPNVARRWMLRGYGFLSSIYRSVVLVSMAWILHSMFAESGLGLVAVALSLLMIGGAIIVPIRELAQRARQRQAVEPQTSRVFRNRMSVLIVLLVAVVFIPLPFSVSAPFVTHPADGQPVFVAASGRLTFARPIGTAVQSGDVLAELVNHGLQSRLEHQRAEVNKLTARLKHLEAQRGRNESLAARIPAVRDELNSAQQRLMQLVSEVGRLKIVSPASGWVLPVPNVPRELLPEELLPDWSGVPQDVTNLGATLHEQTPLCWVGDPNKLDALLLVNQDAVEFLKSGQSVRLQFASQPGRIRTGVIAEIASSRAETLPRELHIAQLAAGHQTANRTEPAETSYTVRVRLTDDTGPAPLYSPGQARIACGTQSFSSRLWRLLRHTFSVNVKS